MMILEKFDRTLTSFLPSGVEGKRFLLAVSGGIDSMCMANLFLSSDLNLEFGIATVNFKLREGDCDLDQELVRKWAAEREIPFHTIEFDTKDYAHKHSISTQMAARDLRYSWFYKLLEEYGFDYIAIAHNMNDSAETLFLNLLRGTGVRGLAGIRGQNGKIIRPLIDISREEIVSYVRENGVPYRDDKTNFESHYSRNRVRNVIFPEFKKINPSFLETVCRSTTYFSQAEDILDDLYEAKRGELIVDRGGVQIIDVERLKCERHIEYWLYRILSEKGFNMTQVGDIRGCMSGQSGKSFQSTTHELIVDRGVLKVYPLEMSQRESFEIESSGTYTFGGVDFSIKFYQKPADFNPVSDKGRLVFSADSITLPITCRGWRSGDRFIPLGMGGVKKLSDFFKDLKMDKREKMLQPVLVNGDEIVCLPGLRIDERYKIKTSTKLVAEVIIVNPQVG